MSRRIAFNYFYGKEADMLSFYRIPKLLFTDDYFKELSTDAKVLYGLLLDRMSISVKNNWFDTEGRAFIYFSIEEIMELLNCGKNKAVKALQELDSVEGIGLVEKERQGQGKATRIYVKNFVIEDSQKFTFETSEEKEQDSEVYISNFKKFDFGDSRSLKSKTQEVCFSGANNTNINNTNDSYTESNLIVSADEMGYDASPIFKAYVQLIRENLAVDTLIEREPMDRELLEGIYELVLETVMTSGQEIIIASNRYPAELVKSKFMKLNSGHVEYVVDSLKSNTTKVRNIKKYLLAALFNAPSTISGYYQAEVNHDMPQFARVR